MKLFEYEAKKIFSRYKIPTPKGRLATSSMQAREIASQLNKPVAVKAQILIGGRAKAGGIRFAITPEETEAEAARLLGSEIKDSTVHSLLVEETVPIRKEVYVSITVDRTIRSYECIASTEGGVEIEETAAASPEEILRIPIDLLYGFHAHQARRIAKKLGYVGSQMLDLASILLQLYRLTIDNDAELSEINPLVEKTDNTFTAVDARMIIDDNSLFRHPEFRNVSLEESGLSPQEFEAKRNDLSYVGLDGDVGVIGNGAGLVMATLDLISLYGGRPASFLDLGGGASAEKMTKALEILMLDARPKVVLVNILGGITRCDELAKGIIEAKRQCGNATPMIIRLIGNNEEEGRRILANSDIQVLESMEEAAARAVEIAVGGR